MAVEMPAVSDERKQLSKNFWLYEFDCRDGTAVPCTLVAELQAFVVENLQPFRDFVNAPVMLTSAYRTPAYNESVDGAKNSYHLYDKPPAFAVDVMVQGMEPVLVKIIMEGLIRVGVMQEGGIGLYKNFVHYDNRGYKARW